MTFNDDDTFINSRMIIMSFIIISITLIFYIQLLIKFGTIDEMNNQLKLFVNENLAKYEFTEIKDLNISSIQNFKPFQLNIK